MTGLHPEASTPAAPSRAAAEAAGQALSLIRGGSHLPHEGRWIPGAPA